MLHCVLLGSLLIVLVLVLGSSPTGIAAKRQVKEDNKARTRVLAGVQTESAESGLTPQLSLLLQRMYEASRELLPNHMPTITPAVIRKGLTPHGYRGNLKRFHNAFAKLFASGSKRLEMCVVGGSMTWGMELPTNVTTAWPEQMAVLLRSAGWVGDVVVHNLASRGTPSDLSQ